jgi:hypothetical protein
LNLNDETSFLPGFKNLHEIKYPWPRIIEAYRYRLVRDGLEINDELPPYEKAIEAFKKQGLEIKPMRYNQIYPKSTIYKWYQVKQLTRYINHWLGSIRNRNKLYHLSYPLVGSYSDIFVISGRTIKKFSHYCGLFAVTNLFVELAIPTAMVLTGEHIVTEEKLKFKGMTLWSKEDFKTLEKYNNKLDKLINNFPTGILYLHPIKLSKWNAN